ncbi:MAG: hypothetical protein PHC88_12950 [Terrimicrobiaceae bacterium]|nr:hypothetical protein [Terrimicrobiaceae bacterium]
MKFARLLAASILAASAGGCVTKTYYVQPSPTPAPRVIYRDAPARKAPVSTSQDSPASFDAVTRPQTYSN